MRLRLRSAESLRKSDGRGVKKQNRKRLNEISLYDHQGELVQRHN